jgi:small-conductance mechanosensitive channel
MTELLHVPEFVEPLSLFTLAIGSGILSMLSRWIASRLVSERPATSVARGVAKFLRNVSIVVFIIASAAVLPPPFSSALPFVVVGAGIAAGWALLPLFRDTFAAGIVMLEGNIQLNDWVIGSDYSGTVSHIGLRATTLTDRHGVTKLIPNRALLETIEVHKFGAPLTVSIQMSTTCDPNITRTRLATLAKESPWRAPNTRVTVRTDNNIAGRFTIHLTVLKPTQSNRCAEALIAANRHSLENT